MHAIQIKYRKLCSHHPTDKKEPTSDPKNVLDFQFSWEIKKNMTFFLFFIKQQLKLHANNLVFSTSV